MSELRYAFRTFVRQPGFTLAATAVLALGMGATTAIYTLIRSILLEPLAYPGSERLVWIWNKPLARDGQLSGLLGADFLEIRDRNHSLEHTVGFFQKIWILTGVGESTAVSGARVSNEFFETLGVHPMLGRTFLADEYWRGHEMEVIFSHGFWQQRFGGDPGVVGRHVTLDGIPYDVVGILPPGLPIEEQFEMLAPLQLDGAFVNGRIGRLMQVFGRLKDGVSAEQANAELVSIAADLSRRIPADRATSVKVVSFLDQEVGGVRRSLWILGAAVGCVLLIACSNVASLLLARGSVRVREMAVRTAMGASRSALIRQLMMESMMLAVIGGALGYPLAIVSVRLLLAFGPHVLPRAGSVHADLGVLAFAFLASLATGVIFGIVPAIRGSRISFGEALKEGGRSGSANRQGNRVRAALVVIEVALGVLLMTAAGLLARSFHALEQVQPGYKVDHVLTMQLALMGHRYDDLNACRHFLEQVTSDVEMIPGVVAAGVTNVLPLDSFKNTAGVWIDTQPVENDETMIQLDNRLVTPGYFRAMGIPLMAGRFFDPGDTADKPVAMIVNESFAHEFFPRGDAVGHRVKMAANPPILGEIVGVVGDFRDASIALAPRRELFTPYSQTTIRGGTMVIRSSGGAEQIAAAVRGVLASIDKNVPAYNVRTMQQQVDDSLAQPRFRGAFLAVFSVVALLLASLGVYGVISCAAAERRHEIGIRVALGARIEQVRAMIVMQGLRLTAIGLALGLAGAAAAARVIRGFLYGVTAADPVAYGATIVIFIAVALAASYFPARRATRADPLRVLREE